MATKTEQAKIDIDLNTAAARKKIEELSAQIEDLGKKKEKAFSDKNLKLAKSIGRDLNYVRKELRAVEGNVVDVEQVLRNMNKVSLNDLHKAHERLRNEVKYLNRDSIEYTVTLGKIKRLESEMSTTKPKTSASGGSAGGLGRLGRWVGGTAVVAMMERTAGRAVELYQRVDDKMADVQKTTGLTKDQVISLDKTLAQIDTRTKREDLLDLARVAGKLGVEGTYNIAGFVRAADHIRVALTEDLGGDVEDSIRQIGKLTEIFKLQDKMGLEQSLIAVGSAINSLGADSVANESYLVDFTNRVAGVAPAMNVSIQDTMGLAATLDILGQTSEVSATTYGQVMMKMLKDTDSFASIAGMQVKDFTDLLDKDANAAFIKFLEGLSSADTTTQANMLASLSLEGQRATQVLLSLGQNTELLRAQQILSNEEFAKATSLIDESNTKNNSAAAIMEKRRKVIEQLTADLGEKLFPLWSDALGLAGNLFKASMPLLEFAIKYRGVIISLAVSVAAYNVISKAQVFWSKAHQLELIKEIRHLTGATTGTKLLAAAKLMLTGNIRAAGVAFKMFWASLGPVGWALMAIGALVSIITVLAKNTDDAARAARALDNVTKRANESCKEEKDNLETLLATARDKTLSDTKRRTAMEDLQRLIPNGTHLINEETLATEAATDAVNKHIEALLIEKRIKEAQKVIDEKTSEYEKKVKNGDDRKVTLWDKTKSVWSQQGAMYSDGYGKASDYVNRDILAKKAAEKYKASIAPYEEIIRKGQQDLSTESATNKWSLAKDQEFLTAKTELNEKVQKGEITSTKAYNSKLLDLEIEALDRRLKANIEKGNERNAIEDELANKMLQKQNNAGGGSWGDPDNGKWSLDKDEKFMREKIELRKRLYSGEIKSEEDYNKELLDLEIKTLDERLKTNADKGTERQELELDLADKRYQKQKEENTRLEKLVAASLEGKDGSDYERQVNAEKNDYDMRLRELDLFGKDREQMTAQELAAIENLERNHNAKIRKIYMDEVERAFNIKKDSAEREINLLKIYKNEELTAADTLSKKKLLIESKMGEDISRQVRTDKQADRTLKDYYDRIESQETQKHLEEMLKLYTTYMEECMITLDDGSTVFLTDEEQQRVREFIDSINSQLAGLKAGKTPDAIDARDKTDILGFSQDDWEKFAENLAEGELQIADWKMAIELVGQAFSAVSQLMSAAEQREFAEYEKTQKKKKETLDKQLKAGVISQENHASQIEAIDKDLDQRKAEMERKQAVRDKAFKIFEAITNTAIGITAALKAGPIIGPILAGIIGALGAVQVATIVATPLPGAEDGGYLDVTRAQDGKRFRAKNDPNARGYVGGTSVIVSEKGEEYVATAAAVGNPTIRPVLDIIEMATRNGMVSTINLPEVIAASVYGRSSGGYIQPSKSAPSLPDIDKSNNQDMNTEVYYALVKTLDKLNGRLAKPFKGYVNLTGEGGIHEAENKYNNIRKEL